MFSHLILDIKFVGCTSRGHTRERSHRISHSPSFCSACLNFSREKDSAIPFPLVDREVELCVVVVVVFLTLTDPIRIQPWSQDRRNQSKSNRESEVSRESIQKRTDKKVASKGHRRDKIENTNKNTQAVETA